MAGRQTIQDEPNDLAAIAQQKVGEKRDQHPRQYHRGYVTEERGKIVGLLLEESIQLVVANLTSGKQPGRGRVARDDLILNGIDGLVEPVPERGQAAGKRVDLGAQPRKQKVGSGKKTQADPQVDHSDCYVTLDQSALGDFYDRVDKVSQRG